MVITGAGFIARSFFLSLSMVIHLSFGFAVKYSGSLEGQKTTESSTIRMAKLDIDWCRWEFNMCACLSEAIWLYVCLRIYVCDPCTDLRRRASVWM